MESLIKLIVVLMVLFAPYVVINSLAVIINGLLKVVYPAYAAAERANEKARSEMENLK